MTLITIEPVDPQEDLAQLVALNCQDVMEWYHYDEDGNPGSVTQWKDLSKWERWMHGGPWLDPELLAFHLEIMEEAEGVVLLAKKDGKSVGEVELVVDSIPDRGQFAQISWIVVDPRTRRVGVGKQLLDSVKEITQERGITSIFVSPENEGAEAFFKTQGFEPSNQMGQFSKQLKASPIQEKNANREVFPLEWKARKKSPFGFNLVLGDNYPSSYTWTYLRYMEDFYALLNSNKPLPHLWLIRQEAAEALTVDYHLVRLWATTRSRKDYDFLRSVLQMTAQLSQANGVTTLMTFAFPEYYPILETEGYQLQQETPYLKLTI